MKMEAGGTAVEVQNIQSGRNEGSLGKQHGVKKTPKTKKPQQKKCCSIWSKTSGFKAQLCLLVAVATGSTLLCPQFCSYEMRIKTCLPLRILANKIEDRNRFGSTECNKCPSSSLSCPQPPSVPVSLVAVAETSGSVVQDLRISRSTRAVWEVEE